MDKEFEFLIRMRIPADLLDSIYDASFIPDVEEDAPLDPKQKMSDIIQSALYDADTAFDLPGEFKVIEVRRTGPQLVPVFSSTRSVETSHD